MIAARIASTGKEAIMGVIKEAKPVSVDVNFTSTVNQNCFDCTCKGCVWDG